MDRSRDGDVNFDDIRQKTARVHEGLLSLLLDVAPQTPSQGPIRKVSIWISQPVMREWTENRLADFNLWVTGISALARSEVSPSMYPLISLMASLLTILASSLEFCRNIGNK
jgi:hypothetical protein